ncbi:6635_t:CDS:2 [Ambispora leptoticha]|uniref:6635_t:CDS:1 n=1 Tax=Ambispora leptoticha TaxID=144679 RepID=A0A9N8VWH2_9GLOM|nr:6635_t:CDS:2 [Ambispora leptoticha]
MVTLAHQKAKEFMYYHPLPCATLTLCEQWKNGDCQLTLFPELLEFLHNYHLGRKPVFKVFNLRLSLRKYEIKFLIADFFTLAEIGVYINEEWNLLFGGKKCELGRLGELGTDAIKSGVIVDRVRQGKEFTQLKGI